MPHIDEETIAAVIAAVNRMEDLYEPELVRRVLECPRKPNGDDWLDVQELLLDLRALDHKGLSGDVITEVATFWSKKLRPSELLVRLHIEDCLDLPAGDVDRELGLLNSRIGWPNPSSKSREILGVLVQSGLAEIYGPENKEWLLANAAEIVELEPPGFAAREVRLTRPIVLVPGFPKTPKWLPMVARYAGVKESEAERFWELAESTDADRPAIARLAFAVSVAPSVTESERTHLLGLVNHYRVEPEILEIMDHVELRTNEESVGGNETLPWCALRIDLKIASEVEVDTHMLALVSLGGKPGRLSRDAIQHVLNIVGLLGQTQYPEEFRLNWVRARSVACGPENPFQTRHRFPRVDRHPVEDAGLPGGGGADGAGQGAVVLTFDPNRKRTRGQGRAGRGLDGPNLTDPPGAGGPPAS